jgi:hypothetical protein
VPALVDLRRWLAFILCYWAGEVEQFSEAAGLDYPRFILDCIFGPSYVVRSAIDHSLIGEKLTKLQWEKLWTGLDFTLSTLKSQADEQTECKEQVEGQPKDVRPV